jgi:hypothetical protein
MLVAKIVCAMVLGMLVVSLLEYFLHPKKRS